MTYFFSRRQLLLFLGVLLLIFNFSYAEFNDSQHVNQQKSQQEEPIVLSNSAASAVNQTTTNIYAQTHTTNEMNHTTTKQETTLHAVEPVDQVQSAPNAYDFQSSVINQSKPASNQTSNKQTQKGNSKKRSWFSSSNSTEENKGFLIISMHPRTLFKDSNVMNMLFGFFLGLTVIALMCGICACCLNQCLELYERRYGQQRRSTRHVEMVEDP